MHAELDPIGIDPDEHGVGILGAAWKIGPESLAPPIANHRSVLDESGAALDGNVRAVRVVLVAERELPGAYDLRRLA